MILAWLVLAAQADTALLDRAKAMLSAERGCPLEPTTDVTVCGLRRADRYRPPLVVHDAGDAAHEGVPEERARWLRRPTPVEALSPFLVGGGMAGVQAKIGAAGTRVATLRPLAP